MFTSHNASNSQVSEVSKIILTFCMMSETRWEAFENVLFFSKQSIVNKLPVMKNIIFNVIPKFYADILNNVKVKATQAIKFV